MRPQPDEFPDHIERSIRAILESGVEAGAVELQPIAYPPREIGKRRSLARSARCEIFRRDKFRCRYCGGKTIPTPIMELLGVAYPEMFPFQSHNWKGGVTHPAILSRSPIVDHVEPVAIGGDPFDPHNLVTACNPCNMNKSDFTLDQIGWQVGPIVDDGWDGLTSLYEPLWRALGEPDAERHQGWIRDLTRT